MSDLARAVVWVDGQVQGVGFRWWAAREAERLGLWGHAENLFDGRVEIDVQGPADDVDALVALATEQPSTSRRPGRVTRTLVERRPPDARASGFDTR